MKKLALGFAFLLTLTSTIYADELTSVLDTMENTAKFSEKLIGVGEHIASITIDRMQKSDNKEHWVMFYTGNKYTITGKGYDGITDMDISIRDYDGNIIKTDTSRDNIPIVEFIPKKTGLYRVVAKAFDTVGDPSEYHFYSFIISFQR